MRLFGNTDQNIQLTEQLIDKVNSFIEKDYQTRLQIVKEEIDSWQDKEENELRELIRSFVVEVAEGKKGTCETSIGVILSDILIQQQAAPQGNDLISQMVSDPNLFSSLERKTGRLHFCRPISSCLEEGVKRAAEDPPLEEDEYLENQLKILRKQRLYALYHLDEVYRHVSSDPKQRVKTKFFPETSAWYIGNLEAENKPLEISMHKIAQKHGITLISDKFQETFANQGNVLILENPGLEKSYFPQDIMDVSYDEIRLPALPIDKPQQDAPASNDPNFLVIWNDRKRRDPLWNRNVKSYGFYSLDARELLAETTSSLGRVFDENYIKGGVVLASSIGANAIMNLTYNEGGNSLIGSRENGSIYVIIGKDSYAVSKAMMERDLGRIMSEGDVKKAFAIDYGVSVNDIYFVEQPGVFHLAYESSYFRARYNRC